MNRQNVKRAILEDLTGHAVKRISGLGYTVYHGVGDNIWFEHKGEVVTYWPYSGKVVGNSVKRTVGLSALVAQLEGE